MNTPIMTLTEVASYLQVNPVTVRMQMRNQGLPYFKIGSDFRFHRGAIDLWILEREKQAHSEQLATQPPHRKKLRALTLLKGNASKET